MVDTYNASQSGAKVVIEAFPQASYNDSVAAASVAGSLPCVLDLDGPTVPNFAWSGYLAPMAITDAELEEMGIIPADVGRFNGQVYALGPFDVALLIYARQSVLEKYEIRIPTLDSPWTLDEFSTILATLQDSGGKRRVLWEGWEGEREQAEPSERRRPFCGQREYRDVREGVGPDCSPKLPETFCLTLTMRRPVPLVLSNGMLKSYMKGQPIVIFNRSSKFWVDFASSAGFWGMGSSSTGGGLARKPWSKGCRTELKVSQLVWRRRVRLARPPLLDLSRKSAISWPNSVITLLDELQLPQMMGIRANGRLLVLKIGAYPSCTRALTIGQDINVVQGFAAPGMNCEMGQRSVLAVCTQ